MDNNVYKYGSASIQDEPNSIIKTHDLLKEKIRSFNVEEENVQRKKTGSKIIGAMVAEIFRKRIDFILCKNNLSNRYKISENNVYVKGCHIEFDFLLLKKDAKKLIVSDDDNIEYELPIYDPKDVVAVLESKTYGIYSLYKGREEEYTVHTEIQRNSLFQFVNAYNDLLYYNPNIKLGYMCIAEQRPKTEGGSNFIERTIYFFEDYFNVYENNSTDETIEDTKSWFVYYAKCNINAKTAKPVFAEEGQFEKFVLNLLN